MGAGCVSTSDYGLGRREKGKRSCVARQVSPPAALRQEAALPHHYLYALSPAAVYVKRPCRATPCPSTEIRGG